MHLAMLGNFASMVVKEIERDRVKRMTSDAASQANNSLKQVCSSLGGSCPICSPAALELPDAQLAWNRGVLSDSPATCSDQAWQLVPLCCTL